MLILSTLLFAYSSTLLLLIEYSTASLLDDPSTLRLDYHITLLLCYSPRSDSPTLVLYNAATMLIPYYTTRLLHDTTTLLLFYRIA